MTFILGDKLRLRKVTHLLKFIQLLQDGRSNGKERCLIPGAGLLNPVRYFHLLSSHPGSESRITCLHLANLSTEVCVT